MWCCKSRPEDNIYTRYLWGIYGFKQINCCGFRIQTGGTSIQQADMLYSCNLVSWTQITIQITKYKLQFNLDLTEKASEQSQYFTVIARQRYWRYLLYTEKYWWIFHLPRNLPDAMPGIYTLIQGTTHSPARETQSWRGVRSHPTQGCISHSKPCRWDCPAPCCRQENERSHPFHREKAALQWSDWQTAGAEGTPEQPGWQRERKQKFQLVKTDRIIFTVWEQRKRFTPRHFSQQLFKVSHLEPQAVGWPLYHREERVWEHIKYYTNGASIQQ